MKAPDHPVPSGDRTMGRLLVQALEAAGHEVSVMSRLRSYLREPNGASQTALLAEAHAEADGLAKSWSESRSPAPQLWLTYHNYYKAPDLLGPDLSRRLAVPYVIAEASHAGRRAAEWGEWHQAAERASRAADMHLCFTGRDEEGLQRLLGGSARLTELPPFIDAALWPEVNRPVRPGPVRIVTVAMMRPGDKLQSYRFLAESLGELQGLDWNLTIIGDGPARADVVAAFDAFPAERLLFTGALPQTDLHDVLAQGDFFAWPGFGEAFGLGYLEAQATGLPVAALRTAGVPSVIEHGRTGLLTPVNVLDYRLALARFLSDAQLRRDLGRAAARWVRERRILDCAVPILAKALDLASTRAGASR